MSDDMKRELIGLRCEMNKGFADLRREMAGMREASERDMRDLRAMFRRTMIQVARTAGDVADVKRDMATHDDISEVTGRIAGLTGKVDDMRLDWARSHDRLNEHERRLDRLDFPQS